MTLLIRPAETAADFAALYAMRELMAVWDMAMTKEAGLDPMDTFNAFYTAGAESLRETYERQGTCILLARSDDQVIGSAGYSPLEQDRNGTTAEVEKFYVAEKARGKGVGRVLLLDVLARMPADGYRHACLETVTFMTAAIALYRAHGFATCAPFRPAPPRLESVTVFMHRSLQDG